MTIIASRRLWCMLRLLEMRRDRGVADVLTRELAMALRFNEFGKAVGVVAKAVAEARLRLVNEMGF